MQRRLQLLAWQQISAQTRAVNAGIAADLLNALSSVDQLPLVDEARPRLERALLGGQRADGTWSREQNSTLQQVLVQTAVAAMALPNDSRGPWVRAVGAGQRHARDVADGYTASVLLATGLVSGPGDHVTHLQQVLDGMLTTAPNGAVTVQVPSGVLDPWGQPPGRSAVTAWAVLALPADHPARGDLVSELMTHWTPTRGFGAGRADGVVLRAIVESLPATVQPVQIRLEAGDVTVARGQLDPAQPHAPLILTVPRDNGGGALTLHAEPAVAGARVRGHPS